MCNVPTRSRLLSALLAACIVVALGACGDGTDAAAGSQSGDLTVVATTTILGDVARNIAGDDANVEVLVPVGVDPHDYQASARQASLVAGADLVVSNGLRLEEGLADLLAAAAADGANVLEVGPQLDPLPFAGVHDDGEGETASLDPHVWLDPIRMAEAGQLVAAALTGVDDGPDWQGRADAYADALRTTDDQIRQVLGIVPASRRVLITNHDSLGYFAERYGFEVAGTVIPGGSTLADPSSSELAALVARVEQAGVAAIFAETTESAALVDAVAAEVGSDVAVVELFTGSLGEAGSGADTLIGMLLTNAERIAAALS